MSIFSTILPQTHETINGSRRWRDRMRRLRRANDHKRVADEIQIAQLESEYEDDESTPAKYSVVAYPTDFTLEVLVDKYSKDEIAVPSFQRRFVWTPTQCSRLIESFLCGLPVPPIYLYSDRDDKLLVIDGQQRLLTIVHFFAGDFGEDESGNKVAFRLSGLNKKSEFFGKSYTDLEMENPAAFKRLNNAVLRAFHIKQIDPKDDSSIYHIFERLNTGGTIARGQEIRNSIYHGAFNDLLNRLNKPKKGSKITKEFAQSVKNWRELIGKPNADKRFRDVELILRFFALHFNSHRYKPTMKVFLNRYMRSKLRAKNDDLREHQEIFQRTVNAVHDALGLKPFHLEAGLNIAVFDSVFVAFAQNLNKIPGDIKARFKRLIRDQKFREYVTLATTNEEVVEKRLEMAKKKLFGRS